MKSPYKTATASTQKVEGKLETNYPFEGVNLSDAQVASAIETINQLKAILPPMPGLTSLDRKRLSKLGQKSRGFVDAAIEAVRKDSGLLPRSISVEELLEQDKLHRQISMVETHLAELQARLDDALCVIGNRLYGSCLTVYAVWDKTIVGRAKMPEQKALLKQRFTPKKASRSADKSTEVK
jgi:hypothetical protein